MALTDVLRNLNLTVEGINKNKKIKDKIIR